MLDLPPLPTSPRVLSVGELNRLVREAIEGNVPYVWVAGEISNFKRYDSGHCYFTLKDETAQAECVMFRHKIMLLGWRPENGARVEVRASATLYEARGRFQLNVDVMRRAGLGALFESYERLKVRLEAEGLFEPSRKRALPRFPRAIGVVSSPHAAALRDVLTTLTRRMPGLPVIIYPTPVQGDGAAARIAQALLKAGARAECDVLILCRGGGSLEDLWAYNDEALARTIAACPIPVVSGVGHETDFTIADFVADARAPTPTAAAQLAVAERAALCNELAQWQTRLGRSISRALESRMQRLDYLSRCLVHPGERIRAQLQHLGHLANRLCGAWRRFSEAREWGLRGLAQALPGARPDLEHLARRQSELKRRLSEAVRLRLDVASGRLTALETHLHHLNPERVLDRGYSIARTASGHIVSDAREIGPGDTLRLTFARGGALAEVKRTEEDDQRDPDKANR
jgi:exodeoxyribonuclease VII large subunit